MLVCLKSCYWLLLWKVKNCQKTSIPDKANRQKSHAAEILKTRELACELAEETKFSIKGASLLANAIAGTQTAVGLGVIEIFVCYKLIFTRRHPVTQKHFVSPKNERSTPGWRKQQTAERKARKVHVANSRGQNRCWKQCPSSSHFWPRSEATGLVLCWLISICLCHLKCPPNPTKTRAWSAVARVDLRRSVSVAEISKSYDHGLCRSSRLRSFLFKASKRNIIN